MKIRTTTKNQRFFVIVRIFIDIFATGVGLLKGVGYWVPGDTWRRGVGVLCPCWTGRGGAVLGCKSPVLWFGAVAIQQRVLVDGNIFACGPIVSLCVIS